MDIKTDLLPLGSVVKVKDSDVKQIILERNVMVNGKKIYNYGAWDYPLGLYGTRIHCFQDEDIEKVYFKGYQDQCDLDFQQSIHDQLKDTKFKDFSKKYWTLKQKILGFFNIYR